jgi:hypothetical protein
VVKDLCARRSGGQRGPRAELHGARVAGHNEDVPGAGGGAAGGVGDGGRAARRQAGAVAVGGGAARIQPPRRVAPPIGSAPFLFLRRRCGRTPLQLRQTPSVASGWVTTVRLQPVTGRMHQLRRHSTRAVLSYPLTPSSFSMERPYRNGPT